MAFTAYPVQIDPQLIVEDMVAQLRAATGAEVNEGHPLIAFGEVFAYRVAETRIVMADISRAIFRDFGTKVHGIAAIGASPAVVDVQFTVQDSDGYTIPEGTRFVYNVTGTERIAFATEAELVIAPGDTTGTVEAWAIIHGTAANGLAAAAVTLVDQLAYVTAVDTTTTTAGGVDAETDAEYVERLVEEIRSSSTGGLVLPADYATAARRVEGVHRALVIPGYEPVGPSSGNERTVTIAVVDEDGAEPAGAVLTAVAEEIEAKREINWVVHVVGPDITAITVTFTAVALIGYDATEVKAAAEAAVEAYLDPSTWGGGDESPPDWRDETVRYLEVAQVINAVDGIDYIVELLLDGSDSNVTLAGVAPLPNPTVTGTVTAA